MQRIYAAPSAAPAVPGAEIKRGPDKGKCSYPAELMAPATPQPYYRCALHGHLPGDAHDLPHDPQP
jgi:hypothetical protein